MGRNVKLPWFFHVCYCSLNFNGKVLSASSIVFLATPLNEDECHHNTFNCVDATEVNFLAEKCGGYRPTKCRRNDVTGNTWPLKDAWTFLILF